MTVPRKPPETASETPRACAVPKLRLVTTL